MSTLERIWLGYCSAMVALALALDGGGDLLHRPWAFALLHVVLGCAQFGIAAVARRHPGRARVLRSVFACIGCPVTFSSYAWLLPMVHPEPFEWLFLGFDLRWFGGDVTRPALAALSPPVLLWLQLTYAAFYLLPVFAALLVARARGGAAFDRAVTILVGGFLISYCGYLLVPTLGPNRIYPLGVEAYGSGLAARIHAWIDAAEANPWDCFPSGHTMLSLVSAICVHRWARAWLVPFLAVALPLVASTICLRYHWPLDVACGAALAWPTVRLIDALLASDGVPSA